MKNLLLLFAAAIFLAGCSHTNELAKYNFNGSSTLYKEFVGREAATIQIIFPKNADQKDKKEEKKEEKKPLNSVPSIGTELLNANKSAEIKQWVDTRLIVSEISLGVQKIFKEFLNAKKVNSIDDNPSLIVETVLDKCELNVTAKGITLEVTADAKIFDRTTGTIAWENTETEIIPLNSLLTSDNKSSSAETKILTAVQLNSITQKDINDCINAAVQSIGRKMGETFRNDLAESKKQSKK
jgi:hypothetical protein